MSDVEKLRKGFYRLVGKTVGLAIAAPSAVILSSTELLCTGRVKESLEWYNDASGALGDWTADNGDEIVKTAGLISGLIPHDKSS